MEWMARLMLDPENEKYFCRQGAVTLTAGGVFSLERIGISIGNTPEPCRA
jgi:hypothetical protein